jgi:hypothetical protein
MYQHRSSYQNPAASSSSRPLLWHLCWRGAASQVNSLLAPYLIGGRRGHDTLPLALRCCRFSECGWIVCFGFRRLSCRRLCELCPSKHTLVHIHLSILFSAENMLRILEFACLSCTHLSGRRRSTSKRTFQRYSWLFARISADLTMGRMWNRKVERTYCSKVNDSCCRLCCTRASNMPSLARCPLQLTMAALCCLEWSNGGLCSWFKHK